MLQTDYALMDLRELREHRDALERLALSAAEKGREEVFNDISARIERINAQIRRKKS